MTEPLKVLDLFSGIGGFSLGLERTGGFKTIAFCEIDNYCQRVLHKHWPEVYIHSDIRTLTAKHFDEYQRPDVICGGFPCQNISYAGKGGGIDGDRSGLWSEMFRLVSELRPRFVIVENVAALLTRGIERVVGDLASTGYDAEWRTVRASWFRAPHERERLFIVAHPPSQRFQGSWALGNEVYPAPDSYWEATDVVDAFQRKALPFVCGRHDGFPKWLGEAALKALGNSIVPQIAEWIGYRILEAESMSF